MPVRGTQGSEAGGDTMLGSWSRGEPPAGKALIVTLYGIRSAMILPFCRFVVRELLRVLGLLGVLDVQIAEEELSCVGKTTGGCGM